MKTLEEYIDAARHEFKPNAFGTARYDDYRIMGTYQYDSFKPTEEIFDTSMLINHTNVCNSEFIILHHAMTNMLIDICRENEIKKVDLLTVEFNIKEDKIEFDMCLPKELDQNQILVDLIQKFFNEHKEDLPKEICLVAFDYDNFDASIENDKWHPGTDASMTFFGDDEDEGYYEEYVLSM